MEGKLKKKFWNIAETDNINGEICFYGDIVWEPPRDFWTGEPLPGEYVTHEGFLNDLEKIKDKQFITIKINSRGGSLETALAIFDELKQLKARKTAIIQNLAASAAVILACSADEVQVFSNSILMIHGVKLGLGGWYDKANIQDQLNGIDAWQKAAANAIATKTGEDPAIYLDLMTADNWFIGQEIVDLKIADTLLNGVVAEMRLSADKKKLFTNGITHDLSVFTLPDKVLNCIGKTTNSYMQTEGKNSMNPLESVTKAIIDGFNSLKPQIQTEQAANTATKDDYVSQQDLQLSIKNAIESERKRIQDIDKIALQIADAELINDAKYANPINAQELALKVMQKQQANASTAVSNISSDYQASGAVDVGVYTDGQNSSEEAQIIAKVNRYKQIKKGGSTCQ